jgi:hypothetical protein
MNGTTLNGPATPEVRIDWAALEAQLGGTLDREELDDLIDELTDRVFRTGGSPAATPCLIKCARRASSPLSLRSAALALAISAPADDAVPVDVIADAYRAAAAHSFLAPSLLDALGLLALRSSLARAELSALLLRLRRDDSRHLLVKGAQLIGRLDALRVDADLRAQLDEFSAAQDPAVQAEARQQLALIILADALLAEDRAQLEVRLIAARAAFARAEMSEEHRPDAAVFVGLLDMLLAFLALSTDPGRVAGDTATLGAALQRCMESLGTHDWHGYRSEEQTFRALHIVHIADALHRAAQAAGWAEEWTNLAAALEELARLHAQVRGRVAPVFEDGRIPAALAGIADAVFAASLGPLLSRVVQKRRLARITSDYILANGDDEVARGLRALEQAAAVMAFDTDAVLSAQLPTDLSELAAQVGWPADVLLAGMVDAMRERRINRWAEEIGLASLPLPIERLTLYGDDPAVDEVVRPLLHQIAGQLGDYPLPKWTRLVDVLVSLVKFAHFVRDRTPGYVVCEEDGGLGQGASERDLQDHLFEALRWEFGQSAVYELSRSGGGRPDTGVVFSECRFPVEAKHEFASIAPEHVRETFLPQSDVYATAADQVSFLMILDLRGGNAAAHRGRRRASGKGSDPVEVVGLYHLRDSFRVESLPADPDIPNATRKIVVIGLVPGNRPMPSSMSTYSRRPSSARRIRRK